MALLEEALDGSPLVTDEDLDIVLDEIGDDRIVLLGEASHGTSEFYSWRARVSRRLIEEKGFSFIAVEGDWPDVYEVNRYAKGYEGSGPDAETVLDRFSRWPTWMWANWEVEAFIEWLRGHNDALPIGRKVGFYGFDVYSLWDSMRTILDFLSDRDPQAYQMALRAWHCFEPYGEEAQDYAWATLSLVPEGCEEEAVELLSSIRHRLPAYAEDWEAKLNAEQNAWVIVGAERYYRTMVRGGAASWNIRDLHMVQTLERLLQYHGPRAKAIVWAHNTHVGDARATDMAGQGMFNVGQLVRERHGRQGVHIVGFGSHGGAVVAARAWGDQMEVMAVPDAREGSWESLFHQRSDKDRIVRIGRFVEDPDVARPRGHRAIGVVYHPEREAFGNFVPSVLPARYDTFIYLDRTAALHPLHAEPPVDREPPETYPFGF